MSRSAVIFALTVLLITTAAQAETVPEYALDRDYTSCMGGETAQKDPQRNEYCNCVRDGMRSWDLETYSSVAMEQSKSQNQPTAKIEELAKGCISKILK